MIRSTPQKMTVAGLGVAGVCFFLTGLLGLTRTAPWAWLMLINGIVFAGLSYMFWKLPWRGRRR